MPELTIQQAADLALQHHQAGRLREAESLYRQILAQQPGHFDAMRLLGLIAHQIGRNDLAAELLRRAIAINPGVPQAHFILGNALKETGQLDSAVAAYRQAIALRPGYAEALCNLGVALQDKRQLKEAIAAYRQAIARNPQLPQAHCNLANALSDQEEFTEAIAAYRKAIQLKPDYAQAHGNLGVALKETGQLDQAIAAYRQALAIHPKDAQFHFNLGNALKDKGQFNEAVAAYQTAIAIQPDYAQAYSNLGNVLKDQKQLPEAIAAYRRAIALNGKLPEAHTNLGNALSDQGQLDEAIAAYREAIAADPAYAPAYNNLGVALKEIGELNGAIAASRRAIALQPDYAEAHSNLVLAMQYDPACDAHGIAEEHRRWNRQHAKPPAKFIKPHANARDPDRKLRIGYVSPDFRDHSVSRFLLPLLRAHDREAFEIHGYSQVKTPDTVTARIQTYCHKWRAIAGVSDECAGEMIRGDKIDILIDLAGHTAGNRLLVFARKPAPVQVTWLGYPATSGLSAMDYRFTDAHADPVGLTDEFNSEQLIRLPQTNWCFQPPENSPAVNELPAIANGRITFGSFNNLAKVNQPLLKLWAKILQAVPGSKLLLKAKPLSCASVQTKVRQIMSEAGIEPERLEFMGLVSSADHLGYYRRIDVALDTYPYHGTTTTCEALWMGVPAVSLAGQSHVSRVGVSLLSNIGLPELIAQSPEQYVRIAADLANDLPRLGELRSSLRRRMEQSPLMDAASFGRNVEAGYRRMWRAWCEKVSDGR